MFHKVNYNKGKENYLVKIEVEVDSKILQNIPAKVFLPVKKYDSPIVEIKIPIEQIEPFYQGKGKISHNSDNLEIHSEEVFFNIEKFDRREMFDHYVKIICEPQNLKIKKINKLYNSTNPILEISINNNSYINFFIQNSFDMLETGEIKLTKSNNLEFELLDQKKFSILKKFYFKNNQNNSVTRFSDTIVKVF